MLFRVGARDGQEILEWGLNVVNLPQRNELRVLIDPLAAAADSHGIVEVVGARRPAHGEAWVRVEGSRDVRGQHKHGAEALSEIGPACLV